jgi:REP-associated tyrosine transposase
MSRLARTVAVGCAHHITQWGNNHQDVFLVDDDRRVYLELLAEQAEKYGLDILGYCLMSNHVHLVAVPKAEEALAKAVGRTHFRYAQYINRFGKRSGHFWQGRFYSCALDTRHFWLALKYIERNPVRARLCRKPWRYEWSSAAAHVDEQAESEILNLRKWYRRTSSEQWRAKLAEGLTAEQMDLLHLRTHTGRPLGSDNFVSKLETALGRRLRPLPRGRPRKDRNPR